MAETPSISAPRSSTSIKPETSIKNVAPPKTQNPGATDSKGTAPDPDTRSKPFSVSNSTTNLSDIKFVQPNISKEDRNRWNPDYSSGSVRNSIKWQDERNRYILKNGAIKLDPTKGTFNPNVNLNQGLANAMVETTKSISVKEGRCYEAVGIAVEKVMSQVTGSNFAIPGAFSPHAAHFAELMRSNTAEGNKLKQSFQEMPVPSSASQIPKGSICVWNRGSKGYSSEAGHISVCGGGAKQYFGTGEQVITDDRLPDFIYVATGNNSSSVKT